MHYTPPAESLVFMGKTPHQTIWCDPGVSQIVTT